MKNEKTSSSDAKAALVKAVLEASSWETIDLERVRTFTASDRDIVKAVWMSWKQLGETDDGEQVFQLGLKSKKIVTRKHQKLGHEDPDVKQLPPHLLL